MTEKDSDEALMLAYASGNANAFMDLYHRHKGGLFRYFKRQCKDHHRAEELYQETWGRLIKGRNNYTVSAKFTTWLYRIAHNLLLDDYRKMSVIKDQVDELNEDVHFKDDALGSSEILAKIEKHHILKHCISELPSVQLEAFILKQESGMALTDIANILGASAEATKSRIRYAINKLSDCVKLKWETNNV